MPPIPVHIEDPISPTQARTAESQPRTSYEPSTDIPPSTPALTTTTTTTTTATPTSTQAYQAARPGGAPVPGPTATATATATPRAIYTPTKTRPLSSQFETDLPPPPQPGDAPSLANATAFHANATSIPPPPKAGSTVPQQPVTVAPPQAQYSPPEQNLAPTRTTEPSIAQRAALNGNASLTVAPIITPLAQHPPGYVQNSYAQELNPAQRASLEVQQEQEKRSEGAGLGTGLLGLNATGSHTGTGQAAGETVGEAWDAVKSWGEGAGQKVSQLAAETHEAAWKWIKKSS